MFGIIYKITNKINGKSYVGQTVRQLKARWSRHKKDAEKNSNLAIHLAIKKYGHDKFEIEILEQCSSLQEMNEKEIFYIKKLKTLYPYGYNLTEGGKGWIPSEEVRLKISKANKGRPSPLKGKKQSEELIEKRSKSLKGRKLSKEHAEKISARRKRPIICVNSGIIYASTKDAAEKLGIFASNIFKVLSGEYKQAKGLTFRYLK